MREIAFAYKGNKFDIQVDDAFSKLPEGEKVAKLERYIEGKYGDKRASSKKADKGILDYLALLERPSQAIKVGLKESALGGNVFRAMGGVDLTPEEGFFTGVKKGFMGEDEVRTQDFLPDDMNPILKGVLGFAGDVATDPLTYMGGSIYRGGKAVGRGVKAATPRSVANYLGKKRDKILDEEFLGGGLHAVARGLNRPIGRSKEVRATGMSAAEHTARRTPAMMKAIGELGDALTRRASETGESLERVQHAFYNLSERPGTWSGDKFLPMSIDNVRDARPELAEQLLEYEKLLGKGLTNKVDEFRGISESMLDVEKAYNIPVHHLDEGTPELWGAVDSKTGLPTDRYSKGYFPRVMTPFGRELREKGGQIEAVDPLTGKPSLDAGYRFERADQATLDSAQRTLLDTLGAKTPNPADNVWDMAYTSKIYHTDPVIAWTKRWNQHNNSLQRKWFADEVTDADILYGMTGGAKKLGGIRQHGFGRWFRNSPDGKGRQQLSLNETGLPVWKAVDPDMDGWTTVNFMKERQMNPPRYYDNKIEELTEHYTNIGVRGGEVLNKDSIKALQLQARKQATKDVEELKKMELVQFKAPKQIAKQMENEMYMMSGEQGINDFLKFYDKTQDAWKSWTLAIRPGYHTRNAVGNMLNAYMVAGLGQNIPKAIQAFKDAAKLQYYSRFSGDEIFRQQTAKNLRNIRGTKLSSADRAALNALPKIDGNTWTAPNFSDTGFSMSDVATNAKARGISAGHYHKDVIRDLEAKAELAADPTKAAQLRRFILDNPAVESGFALGGTIEGNARYGVFIHALREIELAKKAGKLDDVHWIAPNGDKIPLSKIDKSGHVRPVLEDEYVPFDEKLMGTVAPEERLPGFQQSVRPVTYEDAAFDIASMRVKEALFDYSDISRFERNVMKRAMPFYTWTRKNIPAQLKVLVQNPQRAEKIELARQQFEHETGGYDMSEYGAFWGDRVPVFLGAENNGIVKAFTLLNTMPMADLQRILKPKHLIAEMVSPIPKSLFEQIFNYDSFRSRAGQVKQIKEEWQKSKDFLGVPLPPRLWHLAQLIVPLTELNRLNPAGVFGRKTVDPQTRQIEITEAFWGLGARREANPADIPEAARWFRFLTGGRIYDIDLRQQRYYMKKNTEKDLSMLKGKLKWARRKKEFTKANDILDFIEEVQRQKTSDPYNK